MIDINELSTMVKKCIELGTDLPDPGNFETSDIIRLVQRKSLIQEIQDFIYKPSEYTIGLENMGRKNPINNNITIQLEPAKGYRFSKNYKYSFVCSTKTKAGIYSLTIPLLQENAEIFLLGITSLSDPYSMLNYLEYGYSIKNVGISREKKLYLKFSEYRSELDLTPSERVILYLLETNFALSIARLNILWMQESYPEQIEDFDLLQVWSSMIINCHNFNKIESKNLTISDEWFDFSIFSEWSRKNGYELGAVFKRLTEESNYEPSSTLWDNSLKRYPYSLKVDRDSLPFPERYFRDYDKAFELEFFSRTYLYSTELEHEGKTKTFAEWERELGHSFATSLFIRTHFQQEFTTRHLSETKEIYTNKEVEINGETKTIKEWSQVSGISVKTLISRLRYGWDHDNLLKPPRKLKKGDNNKRE